MVDEATTTKWHVKHGPTERRHASQAAGDAASRVIGRRICSKVQSHVFLTFGEWPCNTLWWLLHPPWLPLQEENGASPLGTTQILGHPRLAPAST